MSQPGHIIALDLHEPETLDEDVATYYEKCQAKLGLVPNVIRAYAWNQKGCAISSPSTTSSCSAIQGSAGWSAR